MLKNGLVGIVLGILISSFLISCGVPVIEEIPGYTTVRFFDLKKYADLGFLITPATMYGGNYSAIGSLTIEKMPEAKKIAKGDTVVVPGQKSKRKAVKTWEIEEFGKEYLEAAIDELYQQAKKNGADALVNFNIENITREKVVGPGETIVLVGVRVSGFAIKRLD